MVLSDLEIPPDLKIQLEPVPPVQLAPRGLQNQALANERGTLYVDAIFDTITIQNPVKLVYRCRTPPYLTCIFRKKPSTFFLKQNKIKVKIVLDFSRNRGGTHCIANSNVYVPLFLSMGPSRTIIRTHSSR